MADDVVLSKSLKSLKSSSHEIRAIEEKENAVIRPIVFSRCFIFIISKIEDVIVYNLHIKYRLIYQQSILNMCVQKIIYC